MRLMPSPVGVRVAAGVVVLAGLLAFAGVARAQTPTPTVSPSATPRPGADVGDAEDQVVLSGTVAVPRGRSVGEVVVFHGRVSVAGVVAGDVVVLDGPVSVAGQVSGSVVALNGPIRQASTASVGGDVLASEAVRLAPGAFVAGDVREDVAFTPRGALTALGVLLGAAAVAVSGLLVLLLFLALAPRALDRVATAARTAPFASIGWGLAVAIALPVVAVAAAASVLGLPFGLSLLLGVGLIAMAGYAFAAFSVGRLIVREPRGRPGALFAGWGVAAAIGLVPFLNVAVWVLGSIFGVGASVVANWRARSTTPTRGRHRAGYGPAGSATPAPAPASPPVVVGASPEPEPDPEPEPEPSQEPEPEPEPEPASPSPPATAED
jgi:cytoskeletal protein CcmA (bactofilin family)